MSSSTATINAAPSSATGEKINEAVKEEKAEQEQPEKKEDDAGTSVKESGTQKKVTLFNFRRAILFALLAFAGFIGFFAAFDIDEEGNLIPVDVSHQLREIWVPADVLKDQKPLEHDYLDKFAVLAQQTATCFFWDRAACNKKKDQTKHFFRVPKFLANPLRAVKKNVHGKLVKWRPLRVVGEGLRKTAKLLCTPIRAARGGFKNVKELIGNIKNAFKSLGGLIGPVKGWVEKIQAFVERPKVKVVVNAIKYVVLPVATAVKFLLPFVL